MILSNIKQNLVATMSVQKNNTRYSNTITQLSWDDVEKLNPVKYNGVPHNGMEKHVLVIDWLSIHYYIESAFSIVFDEHGVFTHNNIMIKLLNHHTRHFKNVCEVSVSGVMLGVFCFEPSSSLSYAENSCSFKVDNQLFYSGEWYDLLSEFEQELGLEFRNITRLDIALDTKSHSLFNLVHEYFNCSKDGKTKDIKYLGRSSFQSFGSKYKGKTAYNYKIGVPKSEKSKVNRVMTIYNKTRHLEIVKKPYIEDFHKANLEDSEIDVYRHEMRLQSKSLKSVKYTVVDPSTGEYVERSTINLYDLQNGSVISQLYSFMLKNFVEFTTHSGVKNVTNRKRIALFPFSISNDYVNFVRIKRQTHKTDRTAKISIKFLLNQLFTSDCGNYSIYTTSYIIADLLNSHNIWDWFLEKWHIWTQEFDVHISFYQLYQENTFQEVHAFIKDLYAKS